MGAILAETKRTDPNASSTSLSTSTTGSSACAQLKLSLLILHISCCVVQIPKRFHNDIKASLRADSAMLFLVNLSLAIDPLPEGFLPFDNLPTNLFRP
jgi:hypothetical protein